MNQFQFQADLRAGNVKSVTATLTANVVTVVTLPDGAQGVKLMPTADIRFNLGANPVAANTEVGAAIAATDFVAGGIAKADQVEVRTLELGEGRNLRLLCGDACDVEIEVF